MDALEELYIKIKNADDMGNVIFPKKYIKKFILMNLLMVKDELTVEQQNIFNYFTDNKFKFPASFQSIDKNKQEKYLKTLDEIIKAFNI